MWQMVRLLLSSSSIESGRLKHKDRPAQSQIFEHPQHVIENRAPVLAARFSRYILEDAPTSEINQKSAAVCLLSFHQEAYENTLEDLLKRIKANGFL